MVEIDLIATYTRKLVDPVFRLPFVDMEDEYMYYNARTNYTFMGWNFNYREIESPEIHGIGLGCMTLRRKLHNPEKENLIYSHYAFTIHPAWMTYEHLAKERAAVWLIAHWWAHYIHVCECQLDDKKESHFRRSMEGALLDYYLDKKGIV